MIKQVIFSLTILAGIGFLFNGCQDSNPTFQDPCPMDTCDPYDVNKPEIPDSTTNSDSGSNNNPSGFDTNKVAIAVYQNTTTGGTKQFWTNVPVEIYDYSDQSLGKSFKTESHNIQQLQDQPYAFFEDNSNYIKTPQGQRQFIFKSKFSKNDTTWKGVDTFPIYPNRDDWQGHILEVKPQ